MCIGARLPVFDLMHRASVTANLLCGRMLQHHATGAWAPKKNISRKGQAGPYLALGGNSGPYITLVPTRTPQKVGVFTSPLEAQRARRACFFRGRCGLYPRPTPGCAKAQ